MLACGIDNDLTDEPKMVRVMGLKLNSKLVEFLHSHHLRNAQNERHEKSKMYRRSRWSLRDRLSGRDVVRLIMAVETGMTMEAAAERYGINVKSVRKLLREHGVQQQSNDPFC